VLLHDWRLRDLIVEMRRRAARERIKLLVAVPVERLGLRALLLLLLRAQARHAYHLVAFFVNGQLADGAFESLPAKAPNSILAERAEGLLQNSRATTLCTLSVWDLDGVIEYLWRRKVKLYGESQL